MEVIMIDSKIYKSLVRKIDRIYNYILKQGEKPEEKQTAPPDPSGVWVDNIEAAELLEISKRTLQRLRSNGQITYSIRGGRARYTLLEVQRLIAGRITLSKQEQEADLVEAQQVKSECVESGKSKRVINPNK